MWRRVLKPGITLLRNAGFLNAVISSRPLTALIADEGIPLARDPSKINDEVLFNWWKPDTKKNT